MSALSGVRRGEPELGGRRSRQDRGFHLVSTIRHSAGLGGNLLLRHRTSVVCLLCRTTTCRRTSLFTYSGPRPESSHTALFGKGPGESSGVSRDVGRGSLPRFPHLDEDRPPSSPNVRARSRRHSLPLRGSRSGSGGGLPSCIDYRPGGVRVGRL